VYRNHNDDKPATQWTTTTTTTNNGPTPGSRSCTGTIKLPLNNNNDNDHQCRPTYRLRCSRRICVSSFWYDFFFFFFFLALSRLRVWATTTVAHASTCISSFFFLVNFFKQKAYADYKPPKSVSRPTSLAATDDIPEGSTMTIVLATGDGNTGQFKEEGFLGRNRRIYFFQY
jgi:hypothetical protein